MKLLPVLLACSLLLLNACKDDPITTTTSLPDRASAFLFNGAVGTVYSYRTSSVTVDTNGVETKAGGETITLTISQSIKTNPSGRKYIIYTLPGGDTNQ